VRKAGVAETEQRIKFKTHQKMEVKKKWREDFHVTFCRIHKFSAPESQMSSLVLVSKLFLYVRYTLVSCKDFALGFNVISSNRIYTWTFIDLTIYEQSYFSLEERNTAFLYRKFMRILVREKHIYFYINLCITLLI